MRSVAVSVAATVLMSATPLGAAEAGAPAHESQSVRAVRSGGLTVEQILDIRHPSDPIWEPQGDRIAYLWNDGGVRDVWLVSDSDGAEPERISNAAQAPGVAAFGWHPAGSELLFSLAGSVWRWREGESAAVLFENATAPAYVGDRSVTFIRDGDVWLADSDGRQPRRLGDFGSGEETAHAVAIFAPPAGVAASVLDGGDGEVESGAEWFAVTVSRRQRVEESSGSVAGPKLAFFREAGDLDDLALLRIADGAIVWLERGPAMAGEVTWSSTGMLAWQQVSADAKSRRIVIAARDRPRPASSPSPSAGVAPSTMRGWRRQVVVEEQDSAWWSLTYLAAGPRWSPDGSRIAYLSDASGWAHLYVVDVEPALSTAPVRSAGTSASAEREALGLATGQPRALTSGRFELEAADWHPDGRRFLVSANRGSATERLLFLLEDPDAAHAGVPEMQPISTLRGTSTAATWSPDGGSFMFLHADPTAPLDIWTQDDPQATGRLRARKLTDSWESAPAAEELTAPEIVRFVSADGTVVPAQLFLPNPQTQLNGVGGVPGIVWIHGGGIRQNRFGWHPLRGSAIYYTFHQYLVDRGYAVLSIDYRGSIGYGRDFRVAPHLDLGGGDLDDVLAGGRYLRGLEAVDIQKVGVWGPSYGGYLTLEAMLRAPTAFDAGVDVAGMTDWRDWWRDPGGVWIDGRMDSPTAHPDLYRDRSPIEHVDSLQRPLLLLHGSADGPVSWLESLRLIDELVRAGKPFESMVYPGETHLFTREHTWLDAFRRVEEFFERHLR